jgi:hypothetical protein
LLLLGKFELKFEGQVLLFAALGNKDDFYCSLPACVGACGKKQDPWQTLVAKSKT